MTDQELEQRIRAWYLAEIPPDEAAPAALRSRLVAVPQAVPLPLGRRAPGRGLTLLAAAALLTIAIVGGTLQAGSDVVTPPSVVAPSAASVLPPSAPASVAPSNATAGPVADRILYTRWKLLRSGEADCTSASGFCHGANAFVSNTDGSEERDLIQGPYDFVVAASPDGSSVLVHRRDPDGGHAYLTDVDGSVLERLDGRCEPSCNDDVLGSSFSPDGTRLAWVRTLADERSVIAILTLSTGEVVQLASSVGIAARPSWSPDGSRVAFANHVIDADGGNLLQIAPADLFRGISGEFAVGLAASQWSPDGSLIAFTSYTDRVISGNSQRLNDIYVVRPDGTGLQRLTTDTQGSLGTDEAGDFGASFPTWTRDGYITFSRYPAPFDAPFELWVMDTDGSNARQLDPSDASALTALGCVVCAYPSANNVEIGLPSPIAFWVPAQ